MTPFGEYLRQKRTELGITQKDMAASLGVSAAYLSSLEKGKRGVPTFDLLQRIIGYLNIIWDEAEHLQNLARLSDPRVTIDTINLSPEATELANRLALRISALDEQQIALLLGHLRDEEKN